MHTKTYLHDGVTPPDSRFFQFSRHFKKACQAVLTWYFLQLKKPLPSKRAIWGPLGVRLPQAALKNFQQRTKFFCNFFCTHKASLTDLLLFSSPVLSSVYRGIELDLNYPWLQLKVHGAGEQPKWRLKSEKKWIPNCSSSGMLQLSLIEFLF